MDWIPTEAARFEAPGTEQNAGGQGSQLQLLIGGDVSHDNIGVVTPAIAPVSAAELEAVQGFAR